MPDQKDRDRDDPLVAVALQVVRELHEIHEQLQLINKNNAILLRLAEMEKCMAIKLSELTGEVAGLRTQVKKIWGEQQTKYDVLVTKYDALSATLENQELSPEAEAEVVAFKADLKEFDDTIPDVTA